MARKGGAVTKPVEPRVQERVIPLTSEILECPRCHSPKERTKSGFERHVFERDGAACFVMTNQGRG